MKKISIFLALICVFIGMKAFCYDVSCCPKKPYDVSTSFSQVVSNITGTNFLFTKIAEIEFQKSIRENLGGSGNVEIIPYSAGDFTKGKFKGLKISIPKANKDGIAFSNFKANTLCDFNHIVYEDKKLTFMENFLLDFSLDFTNDDLNSVVNSEKYQNAVKNLNITFGELSFLKVLNPQIKIEKNKLVINFIVETSAIFVKRVDNVKVETGLKIVNGKIKLANMNINGTIVDADVLLPIINKINPFSIHSAFFKESAFTHIENVDIINDTITINGIIFIPKNYVVEE